MVVRNLPWLLFCTSLIAGLYLCILLLNAGSILEDARSESSRLRELKYEKAHNDLSSLLVVHDSIAKIPEEPSLALIRAMISAEFLVLVKLHASGQRETSEYVRCAVTRKLRALNSQGYVYSGPSAAEDWGDENLRMIDEYLQSECPGEPSHGDWSKAAQ